MRETRFVLASSTFRELLWESVAIVCPAAQDLTQSVCGRLTKSLLLSGIENVDPEEAHDL